MADETSSLQNEYIVNKLQEMNQTNAINEFDKNNEAIIDLLNHITRDKEKTNDKLFIISAAYDKVYKKYYGISLSILILSSVVTLIEAFRLSIIELINNKNTDSTNIPVITFVMNVLTLTIGTVITILSSVIRFKNYREILEQLKDKQNLLINYRDKYNRKYEKILNLLAFNNLTLEELKIINEKISEYDNNIKTINVLEYIRNDDIIKFNRYKAYFDFALKKIDIDKEVAIYNYETNHGLKEDAKDNKNNKDKDNKNQKDRDDIILKYMSIQRIKNILLRRKQNDNNENIENNIIENDKIIGNIQII